MAKTSTIAAPPTLEFEDFLAKLGSRDKLNIERHLAACQTETDGDHANLFKRLVQILFTHAGHAVNTIGQHAIQFFVADGKYRKQVFALEDQRDGKILVYMTDVLQQALKAKLIAGHPTGDAPSYTITAAPRESLALSPLDNTNMPNPAAWFKHMLGWNRRALKLTVPITASKAQVDAAEKLLALAAKA
jgi:hypothetical protein